MEPLQAKHWRILLHMVDFRFCIGEGRCEVTSSWLLQDWLRPSEVLSFFTVLFCSSEAFWVRNVTSLERGPWVWRPGNQRLLLIHTTLWGWSHLLIYWFLRNLKGWSRYLGCKRCQIWLCLFNLLKRIISRWCLHAFNEDDADTLRSLMIA